MGLEKPLFENHQMKFHRHVDARLMFAYYRKNCLSSTKLDIFSIFPCHSCLCHIKSLHNSLKFHPFGETRCFLCIRIKKVLNFDA